MLLPGIKTNGLFFAAGGKGQRCLDIIHANEQHERISSWRRPRMYILLNGRYLLCLASVRYNSRFCMTRVMSKADIFA